MRFSGRIYKDKSQWLAEVPLFEAMTQGHSRREALEMIEDWFVSMVNRPGFEVEAVLTGRDVFEVTSNDLKTMISLLLRRRRPQR